MSYFEKLIPSKFHYFKKFNELAELDLKIIFAMVRAGPEGPRNVSRIAKELELPQQTVNYRVLRFDRRDLVRFRAIINESLLGLANYAVITTVRPGLTYENKDGSAVNAGTFLTCYPVWRLFMEVHGAVTHGFFGLYSIPPEKESDLKWFLDELKKMKCIIRVDEFCRVTQSYFNTPSLESYLTMRKAIAEGQLVSFNWDEWVYDFDKAAEVVIAEEDLPAKIRRVPLTYEDLQILFHLERDLREKFVEIGKTVREPSSKITGRYEELLKHGLISGCRSEIYPINPISSMHLTLKIDLSDGVALRKLVSHLDKIPYPVTYQKVIEEEALFLHTIIPCYEYFDFHNAFELLNRRHKIIRNIHLYVSDYYSKFDNIMLFQAFSKDKNKWAFSKDVIRRALQRLIDDTKFEF